MNVIYNKYTDKPMTITGIKEFVDKNQHMINNGDFNYLRISGRVDHEYRMDTVAFLVESGFEVSVYYHYIKASYKLKFGDITRTLDL